VGNIAALAFSLIGRVDELQRHFGGGKGHAIEFKVARLLHLALGHRHVGDDGFADVGLPDADGGHAAAGNARGVYQAHVDGAGAHGGREVAAVAAPVHHRFVDGDLAKQVVHIVAGAGARLRITALLVLDDALPRPSICLPYGSGLPSTRSSRASRAGPGCCAASGRSWSLKNTPLLVPPRM
jgi:hypothetical protein